MFSFRAGEFLRAAWKMSAKFDVFWLRRFVLHPAFDVNQSLQVETDALLNSAAFVFDLNDRDHVKLFDSQINIRFKLSTIRQTLAHFVDDHVKHGPKRFKLKRDHVKLRL